MFVLIHSIWIGLKIPMGLLGYWPSGVIKFPVVFQKATMKYTGKDLVKDTLW